MEKFLLIGLGNPGEKYENTRHNIGFRIAEALSFRLDASFESEKYGDLARCKIKGRQVFILKPNTFMNLSGTAVRYYLQLNKIKLDNILVIADDLHLPFGKIKIRRKGSDGGHNGHKDIIGKLSTTHYCRLKFGIGLDFQPGQQSHYVLNSWSEAEVNMLTNSINVSVDAIINFCTLGIEQTMAEFNSL